MAASKSCRQGTGRCRRRQPGRRVELLDRHAGGIATYADLRKPFCSLLGTVRGALGGGGGVTDGGIRGVASGGGGGRSSVATNCAVGGVMAIAISAAVPSLCATLKPIEVALGYAVRHWAAIRGRGRT
ncbi:hypothetical protein [Streptomyces sp. NPDC050355]|uniref:hypothetical protein n=1 Tax=Streptomyces sp. NPDC050355 TaxID=3365609 RepID=UPI0037982052